MSRLVIGLVLVVTVATATQAAAQTPAPVPDGMLKVLLTCDGCDTAFFRETIKFVQFVTDPAVADVEVVGRSVPAGADQRWTLVFTGKGRFSGQNRTVPFHVPQTATSEALRTDVAHFLKLGLSEYAAATPAGANLELTFKRPGAAAGANAAKDQKDPWNYWVYRFGASGNGSGESSQFYGSYYASGSANRTTENWKMRFSFGRSLSKSTFEIDESLTIKTKQADWSVDSLIVKSLGPKWSFGVTSALVGSTYSNSRRVGRFTPGIEFDVFPYSESSKRSLTLQYTVGGAHYDYLEITIFDKLHEWIAQHAATVSAGFRQPWGSLGGSFVFSQQLSAPERTRLSLNGSFNIRLIKALTLNANGSYSRIRDLFTLEKGEATDDEVLLRQRQLATGFRYSFGFGISYSFGSMSNDTVNPRFGG